MNRMADREGGGGAIDISRRPFVIVVSGPSGVGKSVIVTGLLERASNLCRSVSFTTRPPREGERDGDAYHFITVAEFEKRRKAGEMLEWAAVHGDLYGTPLDFVDDRLVSGMNVVLEIDVQGGMIVKEKLADAVLIFLLPPTFEELERRLRKRSTDSEEVISRRLKNAKKELTYYNRYDYLVINDELESCIAGVTDIVGAETLRRERTGLKISY
jgi:guanylate kinase